MDCDLQDNPKYIPDLIKKFKEGYDIVATGEVMGQRPFSQNKEALVKVKNLSGVEVLRPLSAKLLDETDKKNTIL